MRAAAPACAATCCAREVKTGEQFGIDFERVLRTTAGLKCSEHSTFPRRTAAATAARKSDFGAAEFLGQSAAQLEKAMIDRLEFPGQQSPGELPLASGKAGHATNHRGRRQNRP